MCLSIMSNRRSYRNDSSADFNSLKISAQHKWVASSLFIFLEHSSLVPPSSSTYYYLVTQLLLRNAMALQAPACYQNYAKLELGHGQQPPAATLNPTGTPT